MAQDDIQLTWAHGDFTVVPVGAMCGPAHFALSDGRRIQPFAVASWTDDGSDEFAALPPLLKRLRGDWPCVPFGMPQTRADLPADWLPATAAIAGLGDWFHGPGANLAWQVKETAAGALTLELDYPDTHPIRRLVRRISGDPAAAKLHFDLEVHPRVDCRLPIGVHPVLRLPADPQKAHLTVEGASGIYTYPVDAEPGVSQLPHGARFERLEAATWSDGEPLDLSRHPLPRRTEEIVLVAGATGRAHLDNTEEGYRVTVAWDPAAFASCNLWISNGGRGFFPWNHAFRGLGIEPVTAPFDLGTAVAAHGAGPLVRAGVPCTVDFRAGQAWATRYSIEVAAI